MQIRPGVFESEDGVIRLGGTGPNSHPHYIACPITTNYLRYLPMVGLSVDTSIDKYYCMKLAPEAGYLSRVIFRAQNAVANMALGVHANGNAVAVETASAALSAGVAKEILFQQKAHFAAKDRVHVSYNPNGTVPGDCQITLEWVYLKG